MRRYAMIVVVEAESEEDAWESFRADLDGDSNRVQFLSNGWEVPETDGDYYTEGLIRERIRNGDSLWEAGD